MAVGSKRTELEHLRHRQQALVSIWVELDTMREILRAAKTLSDQRASLKEWEPTTPVGRKIQGSTPRLPKKVVEIEIDGFERRITKIRRHIARLAADWRFIYEVRDG